MLPFLPGSPALQADAELSDRDFKQLFFKGMPLSWREKLEDIREPNAAPIEEIEAYMERLDVRECLKDKKKPDANDNSHGSDNGRRSGRGGRGRGQGRGCGRGNGNGRGGCGGKNNNNNNGGGKIKASDPCPLPTHSGHTWGECYQNVANTNNNNNNNRRSGGGGGGGGGNSHRNNNRGSGGDAHVNEDNNNNNNDHLSRSSRSSRHSNNNNQDDGHYVSIENMSLLDDMFHVEDEIDDEYYNQGPNRFSVNLADNFKHYAIGEAMQCQEIVATDRTPYGLNNLMFDDVTVTSSDGSSLGSEPPPLIKREHIDSSSDDDSTAATELSTICSWDMLKADALDDIKVTANSETLIVSLPPLKYNRLLMGLSTSPYEVLVAAKTDKSDLAPTTMISVTKINDSHQGRFRFKALFDSGSTNNIIS